MGDLQRLRLNYQPSLPAVLQGTSVRVEYSDATRASDPSEADTISQLLPNTYAQPLVRFVVDNTSSSNHSPPLRVGVVFCGRQSPGGHNVIWGIYDALKAHNPDSCLLGFLDGSEGLFAQRTLEITDDIISNYRNQGGYDMLGRTKDQIRTDEQIDATLAACTSLKLDGLVIIGGVTSNTDAAQLAEKFAEEKCSTKVVGVPVTLNGDLKNQFVETNVGFDTICKVNSQLISNVCTDALSAQKYYYFIRLMGRKASHVALECTLQSHPNMVILGEEVSASKLTLSDLTKQICNTVQARAEQDKYHGVYLLPEGLIESIPEVYALLQEIHGLLRQGVSVDDISSQLSPTASSLFELLPSFIREQFLLSPESDDSAQLSQIETEKLLAQLVEEEMNKRANEGTYKGKKFNAICHFFGYQARGSVPSKFDCDYAFVLGHVCYHILAAGLTGYLATVTNLKNPVDKWRCGAAPITAMMTVKRFGYGPGVSSLGKPALHPATVDLKGKAYELLRQNATKFLMDDVYRNTGPLQFDGPGADSKAVTLCIENQDYVDGMEEELVVGQVESKTLPPPLVLEAEQVESETTPPPLVLEVDQVESETTLLGLEVENQKNTSAAPPPATSVSVVSQSHQQEKAIDLEPFVMVEFREEDNVPEANVLVDSKNSCPTSKPKEEKVPVTNNPSNGQIQDATILKGSSELENMPDGSMKAETEVDNQKIAMVVVPPATSESGDILQYHEQEEVTKDPSQVDKVPEVNVIADSKNSCPTSKPKEEMAPVTNNPSDGQVQDATVLKAETEADKQKKVPAPPPATSNSGDAPESHEQEDALSSEPERETAPVTKYPNGCQIQDATVQKDSTEMNNGLCLSDYSIRAETKVDNYQSTTVAPSPATSEYVLQPHEQEGVASSKLELEKAAVTIDPSEDAIVLKESLEMDNNLHSPDESMRVETEVANQKSTMAAPPAATFNSGDVPLSHGQKEATSSESVPVLESKDEDNVPSADVLVDRVDCGPISIPDEVDASVTEDPSDGQIKDETVQKELSKKDDGLHSPDDCVKPDTVGDDLLRSVKNTREVEVTNTSNKVNEISKSENVTDSSCTDDNREECNHPSEAGVEIPVVSCHVNGSLVHDVGRNGVSDLISDSEILSHSSTNGINISPTDGAAISQSQVQFGSFVPAIYHVNGSCGDDSGRITSQDANGFEHVRRGDFSKPPLSLEGFSVHPVVEKTVAVECIERPFNILIKVPKHFDIELDDDQFRQTELLVEEKTAKRDAIKSKMQMIRRNVQQTRSALTDIASEERAARRSVKLKRQEIDFVHAVINRVKNALSVDDIDMRIKHIEHMMQHETMPLKDEKQYIHDIKQLKLYRETLSSNMGSQDEVREALDQKDQIEDRLKVLKMDLDRLKKIHSTAEAATVAADKKLKVEKKKLEEMYAEYVEAQNLRQEAYVNLQLLKRRFYEKNAHFRKYKDDLAAAESSRDKGALHHLCLNQVEKMMELWNNDDKFRKEYVRCNTRSTIWRLGTMDGRALGPGEESPVVVDGRNKSSRYKVGQVNPELALVSPDLEKKDEQPLFTKAVEIAKVVAVEKIVEKTNKAVEKTNNAVKTKKADKVSLVNSSPPIDSLVESIATSEEESAIKQTKEEQEVAMGEEQLRKAEEEAKLKEQRRLEEIAKAKEALERKRKIAEKAQLRAEMRAQKEAEQKDKEKEKRAKKKERKKAGASDSNSEGGDIMVPTSEVTVVKEAHIKEGMVPAATSKRPLKVYTKQLSKMKSSSSIPPPLRNKNKRRMQQWMWISVATIVVVLAVIVLGNMGLYSNKLGRNRHPGF